MVDNLDKDLEDAMKMDTLMRQDKPRLHAVTPSSITKIIEDATNPDTGRASKSMLDQMTKIIAGLEREIDETTGVRDIIDARVRDLQVTMDTAKQAVKFLQLGK